MNPNSGRLLEHYGDIMNEVAQRETPLIPVSEEQAVQIRDKKPQYRKGYMRNQPCVCGSGKKFKRCCWDLYAHHQPLPEAVTEE